MPLSAAAPRAPAAAAAPRGGAEGDRREEQDGGRRDDPARERRAVRGLLVILSAPSGAGKDTVIQGLLRELEDSTLYVTATSREPRPGEVHGKDYFFYSPQK
ncbi:MAG: hypothetical protein HYY42_04000, partial [Chloroflexi bacterium]|nr:hypothetical protein [Chloroflexota bacterium]